MIVFACREKVRHIRFSTGNNGVFILYEEKLEMVDKIP